MLVLWKFCKSTYMHVIGGIARCSIHSPGLLDHRPTKFQRHSTAVHHATSQPTGWHRMPNTRPIQRTNSSRAYEKTSPTPSRQFHLPTRLHSNRNRTSPTRKPLDYHYASGPSSAGTTGWKPRSWLCLSRTKVYVS